jgi:ABC-type transport system substrate-binding protein
MMSPERIYHPLYNDNTVFARAVEDMMRSTDLEIQKQKYHEALQELHDQAAIIPLIFEYYYYAYNNRIQGLELTNPNQIFVDLWQATLK